MMSKTKAECVFRNLLGPNPTSQFDAILGIIESRIIPTMKNSGNHLETDSSESIQMNVVDQNSFSTRKYSKLLPAINPEESSSLKLYFLLDVGERSTTGKLYNKMQDIWTSRGSRKVLICTKILCIVYAYFTFPTKYRLYTNSRDAANF